MILDRLANAKNYLGISTELDTALTALTELDLSKPMPERTEISETSYYSYSERNLLPRRHSFEFHRKYIDIHVPMNVTEQIAICATDSAPQGTDFNLEKDFGFFHAEDVAVVNVPAGWFCICFPEDAHEPLIGDESTVIRKLVFKVLA